MLRTVCLRLSVVCLALATVCILCPNLAVNVGLDVWNLKDLERERAASNELVAELDRKNRIMFQRCLAKREATCELLAGRMSLAEAAERFQQITEEPRESPAQPPDARSFPGQTKSERYCRQVLQWVMTETRDWEPSEAEEAQCRLEAEFATFLEGMSRRLHAR